MADLRTDAATVRTSRRARLAFGLVGALLGATVGGAVMYYSARTGDEPPIWVKNGSIVIELGGKGGKWNQQNASAPWMIPGTARARDQYDVFIAPSTAASCPTGFHHTGQSVDFKYSDGLVVSFTASGKRSAVRPPGGKAFTPSSDKRSLTYDAGGTGYIKEISVNANVVCTFDASDANLAAVLLDK